MLCIACARPAASLCDRCTATLSRVPPRTVDGVLAEAPFRHAGAAARLITGLKYRRNLGAASFLADAMAPLVPEGATALVPVPRAGYRRVRYGIDPSVELARMIGRRTRVGVEHALVSPWWWRQRAGTPRPRRGPVAFTRTHQPVPGWVLIDDVITTGATLSSALAAIGATDGSILTATAASSIW